jgi:hypothetical protein
MSVRVGVTVPSIATPPQLQGTHWGHAGGLSELCRKYATHILQRLNCRSPLVAVIIIVIVPLR